MSLFWLSWSISSTINEQGGKQITATLTTFGQSILALDKTSYMWLWSDKKPQKLWPGKNGGQFKFRVSAVQIGKEDNEVYYRRFLLRFPLKKFLP